MPTFAEPWQSRLVPALHEMGSFVLDPRFSACRNVCNRAYSDEIGSGGSNEDFLVVSKIRATKELGCLTPNGLSPGARESLLEWLVQAAEALGGTTGPFNSGANVEFLRTLPLYPTLAGGIAAIEGGSQSAATHGAADEGMLALVAGPGNLLPPQLLQKLLRLEDKFGTLYSMLGVPILSTPQLLAIVLRWEGGFSGLPIPAQEACINLIESNWEEFQDDYLCMQAMAAAAFVSTANNGLASPKDLYDPTVSLLATVFAGQPVFPHGRFSATPWLEVLRSLGLRRSLDRGTFLDAARRVSQQASQLGARGGGRALGKPGQLLSGEAAQLWDAASSLARHLVEGEGVGLLSRNEGREFAEKLRLVRVESETIYTTRQPPICRGCVNLHSLYRTSLQVAFVPTKLYTVGVSTAACTLATFMEIILPSDVALAWTEGRVLDPDAAPPPPGTTHASLRIRSPPPFDLVAAHLQKVGKGGGEAALSCWPFPDHNPAEACRRILEYLNDEGLSERQLERLKGIPLVPVDNGSHLESPDALFLRTLVDARPLMYELPPTLIPNLAVLKSLGLKDAPATSDLLDAVCALPTAYTLPTPKILAVSSVLHHLLVESPAPEALAASRRGEIWVPNALGIMTSPHACCWADVSLWDTASRLVKTQINVAHPRMNAAVCKALGIPSLSDVIEECLDSSREGQPIAEIQGKTPAEIASRLREPCVSASVYDALQAQRCWAAGNAAKYDQPAYEISATAVSQEEVAQALENAAVGLRFVESCWTVLQLRVTRDMKQQLEGTEAQVPCHAEKRCLVLAAEPPAALSATVALAISKLFQAPALLPIASLFDAPKELLIATAGLVSGSLDGTARFSDASVPSSADGTAATSALSLAISAGQLGALLTPGDFSAARLLPLRRYVAGELVAVRMPAGQLRYARIVADSGPPSGAAVYRATVEIAPGKFRDILSSEIMGFDSNTTGEGKLVADEAPLSGPLATGLPGPERSPLQRDQQPSSARSPAAASPDEVFQAVRSMLTAAGVVLDSESSDLLEQSLVLRQQLQATKEQLKSSVSQKAQMEEDAAQVRAAWQCRICLQREVNTVMVGCGHVLCSDCAAAMPRRSCPFCRTPSQMTKLYR